MGGADAGSGGAGGLSCSDLFAPTLQTYSIDISDSDWNAIQAEFMSAGMLTDQAFFDYQPKYYPVVFHFGNDASKNAYIRLKGDSSWREAVQYDGADGKMQFVVAFDQLDSTATFHGVGKIGFDMPRADLSFLHERIGNTWMRQIGIPALCATSGKLMVNGNYYGLYVAEERMGHRVLQEFFPGNATNDLFKGGATAETNQSTANWNKLGTVLERDHAGGAGGDRRPAAVVPDLGRRDDAQRRRRLLGRRPQLLPLRPGARARATSFCPPTSIRSSTSCSTFTGDPVWWWSSRPGLQFIGQQYRTAMNDATLRGQYASAVATQFGHFDVSQLQGWLDQWSAQIRDAVAADPHKPSSTTAAVFDTAVALARQGVQTRADFVSKWLDCQQSGSGVDQDGDGYIWCKDCDDTSATTHPGAPEICGNQVDDNCNGLYDEGCPTGGSADAGTTDAATPDAGSARDAGTD